jgi:hypothetical protein
MSHLAWKTGLTRASNRGPREIEDFVGWSIAGPYGTVAKKRDRAGLRAARAVAHFALLVSLSSVLPASAATNLEGPASPQALAKVWAGAETQLAEAIADQQRIAAEPPEAELMLQARHQLRLAEADFRFRDAARAEQVVVYAMAVDPQVQSATEPMLPQQQLEPIRYTITGLRALWHAAGIADFASVRVRHNRDFTESAPVEALTGFYKASGARHSIDWSYLASINYVESDFGRVNGPSSAGAVGPMQFMPGTWSDFGNGGDVMSPQDSI